MIDVGKQLSLPVVLAGQGPDRARLENYAKVQGVSVSFVLSPSDQMLFALYQTAELYVFPPVEDFGIMPVEAMAAGARVLANQFGGASETVIDGRTGALADFRDEKSTKSAAERAIESTRINSKIQANAFSKERFQNDLKHWVNDGLKGN